MRYIYAAWLLIFSCFAAAKHTSFDHTDFYKTPPSIEKAIAISAALQGKPYQAFLLGEGPHDSMTPRPLYRLDAFDCLTYVETVLALTYAQDEAGFLQHYKALKYYGQPEDFFHRNHFTHLQWNHSNQAQGYLHPYVPPLDARFTTTLTTQIDIPNWYRYLSTHPATWKRISGQVLTATTKQRLEDAAQTTSPSISTLTYFPTHTLLTADGKLSATIYRILPKLSLVEVVRKNWNTTAHIGTPLDISHLGFVLREGDTFILRHASERHQRVTDEPLARYLQEQSKQPSFAGLYIQTLNLH